MSYKVIVDSCGELTPDMKKAGNIFTASLTLNVGGHLVVDDETFDQADFWPVWQDAVNVLSHPVRLRRLI